MPSAPHDLDTVTIARAELEAILDELEDAEDRIAVLEHAVDPQPMLTLDEVERMMSAGNGA